MIIHSSKRSQNQTTNVSPSMVPEKVIVGTTTKRDQDQTTTKPLSLATEKEIVGVIKDED